MNSKNYYIAGIVLIVIVIAAAVLKGSYTAKPQGADTVQNQPVAAASSLPVETNTGTDQIQKPTVEYTPNGFIPKSLTVKVDTGVTWVNRDSDEMWVASAPHPQHTDLPGFDELRGAKTGDFYTYNFTKAGTWKYHNHLNPKNFGEVVVEP